MKTIVKIFSIAILFLFSFFCAQDVFAHGDDARIEISSERLNPGGVLDVRGVGFEPEAEITLTLVGSQVEVPVGAMVADEEGHFHMTFPLPVDLAEGTYVIRGTSQDGHAIDSPQLAIWGSADLGSADGEPRAEDDGLLAPMPTVGVGVPTPLMSSAPPVESSLPDESSPIPYTWLALAVGIAVASILIVVLKKR